MTRGTPLRPVLAALLALALLAGLSPSAGAVLGPEARTDTVALTQSVATVDSIATLDSASHRFGFSLGSVLAQATAIQKVITNAGGTVQPPGTTTATVAPGQQVVFNVNLTGTNPAAPTVVLDFFNTNLQFLGGDFCVQAPLNAAGLVVAGGTTTAVPAGTSALLCTVPAGQTSVGLQFQVSPTAAQGAVATNQACAQAGVVGTAFNICATAVVTVGAAAGGGATITKSDSPDPVAAGGTLTFSIPVSNPTNAAVTNVQVTDNLPSGLTLTATPTSTVGTCTGAVGTSTFTCTIGTLGAGQIATITATALVPTTTANGTVITNTATLTFTAAGNVSQTVTSSSSTTVSGAAGALTITKTGSPATVTVTDPFASGLGGTGIGGLGTGFGFNPGLSSGFSLLPPATLTYTVTVSNPATAAAAQNVVVTDTLPANVSFVSATSTVGTCTGSTGVTTVTCNVGTLNAGQTATITIVVNVISSPAACNTTLTNTASVTATGLTAPAPATTTTTVTCPGLSGQGLPLLPPPPLMFLPPPPPPLLPPPPGMGMGQMAAPRAAFPEVPVIPEADSLFLLVGGLVALGGLVGYRKLRRRDDA